MLVSLIALAIAISALYISRKLSDEVTRLLIRGVGLFSLFLSLAYSAWFIKLLIVGAIAVTSGCVRRRYLRQIRCPSFCTARPNCLHLPT
jgi:hypothetical protein